MNALEERPNLRTLCDAADFIDSGFQSFREQTKLPAKQIPQAAFFCGASLVLKLLDFFKASGYSDEDVEFLTSLISFELSEYMVRHDLKLEWEPHVPNRYKQ